MTSLSKNHTALAEAIIDSAGISPGRKSRYKGQWRKWDRWCSEYNVDPYHATLEDMDKYWVDHPNMSKSTRKRLSGAVNLVYKMAPGYGPVHLIGKPNHKPTSELQNGNLREYQIWSSQFINWCHARGKTAIPADQHDIAAFMQGISAGYLPSTAINIFTEISRLHAQAGYHDISKLPAVATVLSDIRARIQQGEAETTPRAKTPSTTEKRVIHRNNWRYWAKENDVDIDAPTTANLCDFIREESKYLIVKRLRPKLLAISEMYESHLDPTKALEVTELLDALVQQDAEEKRQGIKKLKRNANPLLSAPLPTDPNLVEQLRSEGLTEQEIQRLTSFQDHRLAAKTRKNYQRYWARYKIWCRKKGKTTGRRRSRPPVSLPHRTSPIHQPTHVEKPPGRDPLLLQAHPSLRQPRIKPPGPFNHDGHSDRQSDRANLDDRAPTRTLRKNQGKRSRTTAMGKTPPD